MKKSLLLFLIILLITALALSVTACVEPDESTLSPSPSPSNTVEDDGDYIFQIQGITSDTIEVTKDQILAISETKLVEYTDAAPCYSSDKRDPDTQELIPHTLKGVYLDDILAVYADGVLSGAYSAMGVYALDGYETVLTSDTFNTEQGGSKMIIAFEYDGETLNASHNMGSLRAVFPDQVNSSWVYKLKKVVFSDAALTPPAATVLNFVELLGDTYDGNFTKNETIGDNTVEYTYYGISVDALLDGGILSAEETDKMYLVAWDFITNGTNSFYRQYTNWKSYEYFSDAYLVYEKQPTGEAKEAYDLAPLFYGDNILSGMSVKNTLAMSVGSTALVTLDIAYERYDVDSNNVIDFADVLELVSMMDNEASYTVTTSTDQTVTISGADMEDATLVKNGAVYELHYGASGVVEIKTIAIVQE
jgi:hypothetical protein